MAAQLAVNRGRNIKRSISQVEDSIEYKKLPDKKERIFDVELAILMLNG